MVRPDEDAVQVLRVSGHEKSPYFHENYPNRAVHLNHGATTGSTPNAGHQSHLANSYGLYKIFSIFMYN